MPFSRTTATRVPAGSLILSPGPLRSVAARGLATGGGASVCGPGGSCASAHPLEMDITTKPPRAKEAKREMFMMALRNCHSDARRSKNGCLRVYAGNQVVEVRFSAY